MRRLSVMSFSLMCDEIPKVSTSWSILEWPLPLFKNENPKRNFHFQVLQILALNMLYFPKGCRLCDRLSVVSVVSVAFKICQSAVSTVSEPWTVNCASRVRCVSQLCYWFSFTVSCASCVSCGRCVSCDGRVGCVTCVSCVCRLCQLC